MADRQPAVTVARIERDEHGRPMICVSADIGSVVRIGWLLGNRVVEVDDVSWSLADGMPTVKIVSRP